MWNWTPTMFSQSCPFLLFRGSFQESPGYWFSIVGWIIKFAKILMLILIIFVLSVTHRLKITLFRACDIECLVFAIKTSSDLTFTSQRIKVRKIMHIWCIFLNQKTQIQNYRTPFIPDTNFTVPVGWPVSDSLVEFYKTIAFLHCEFIYSKSPQPNIVMIRFGTYNFRLTMIKPPFSQHWLFDCSEKLLLKI